MRSKTNFRVLTRPLNSPDLSLVRCAGQTRLIHKGLTLQLTGLKWSATNVLVPDTFRGLVEYRHWQVRAVLVTQGGSTQCKTSCFNIMADHCISDRQYIFSKLCSVVQNSLEGRGIKAFWKLYHSSALFFNRSCLTQATQYAPLLQFCLAPSGC